MWRALVFLGLICLGAYGAVWLADHPETVAVTWAGREYSTSLAIAVIGLIAIAITLSALLGTIRYVFALPGILRRGARRRRQGKGLSALSRGIVAVGAGDLVAARRHASEAGRLLGNEPLALLLKAQAAQASGDRETAEAAFCEMAGKPETRVLGLRGLYLEAQRRGEIEEARHHAQEAAQIAPAVAWASDAVLEAHCADGDWAGAIRLVERRTSLGLIDRASSRRQRAVLMTADAMSREPRDPEGAFAAAQQAVKLAPDFVPAATLASRLLSRRGELKRAAKTIETAWRALPHPDLAGAYLNLRPGDSASDRLARAETLARLSSWSAESRFAIARAAIESRELARAREVLRPLLDDEGRPTVRLCMAMAEIEGRDGNPGTAREWLARAAWAPRDKAWIADGVVSDAWAPVSPVTGRIDAFRWETPPETMGAPGEPEAISFSPPEPEELPALKLAAPPAAHPAPSEGTASPPQADPPGPAAAEPVRRVQPARSAPAASAAPAVAPAPAVAAAPSVPAAPAVPAVAAASRAVRPAGPEAVPAKPALAAARPVAEPVQPPTPEPGPRAAAETSAAAPTRPVVEPVRPAPEPVRLASAAARPAPAAAKSVGTAGAPSPEPPHPLTIPPRSAAPAPPEPEPPHPLTIPPRSAAAAPASPSPEREPPPPLAVPARPAAAPSPPPERETPPESEAQPPLAVPPRPAAAAPASPPESGAPHPLTVPPRSAAIVAEAPLPPPEPEPEPEPPHPLTIPPRAATAATPVVPGPEPAVGPTAATASAPRASPNGPANVARIAPGREPEPVIFPVAHAPDDPGTDGQEDRRQRFRLRV